MTKTTKLILVGLVLVTLVGVVFMQFPGPLRTIGVSLWGIEVVGGILLTTGVLTLVYNKVFGTPVVSTSPTPIPDGITKVDTSSPNRSNEV